MKGSWAVCTVAAALAAAGPAAPAHGASMPDWLKPLAALATPPDSAHAGAWVLLHERQVVVAPGKRVATTERGAVRVLEARGKAAAACAVRYLKRTSEVTGLRAWQVNPGGDLVALGGKHALDIALAGEGTLATDARLRSLMADDPRPGTLFAWEWTVEERPLLAQWEWPFQGSWPAAVSRFSLTLPEGAEPEARIFNHEPVAAQRSGNTWTWELRDLPGVPVEPDGPQVEGLVPWLAVTARAGTGDNPAGAGFSGWEEVSRWLHEVAAAQAAPRPELGARAQQLTRGLTQPLDRIRAIGRYVQDLNYVHIALGTGFGEGYRPRPAAEVLQTGYGDCKDKANLMRTLLAEAGVEAWLMPVYLGDRRHVREEWPGPAQFNHCIVAIRAPEGVELPSVARETPLGPLLVFDPTDPHCTLGDLPDSEQGSLALVQAPSRGALVRLPVAPADACRQERRIRATLDGRGGLAARLHERSVGQPAAEERRLLRESSASDYRRVIESWLAVAGGGVQVGELSPTDRPDEGVFELEVEFEAPLFARTIGGRLLSFRPGVLTPRGALALPDTLRRTPVELHARSFAESVTVGLPDGWAVDELPARVEMRTDFGTVEADWRAESGLLRFHRAWSIRPALLPPERYGEVRRFTAALHGAGQAAVVLSRR